MDAPLTYYVPHVRPDQQSVCHITRRVRIKQLNFSNPYLVSSFFDYIVHLAGWWDPSPIYDPTPKMFAFPTGQKF